MNGLQQRTGKQRILSAVSKKGSRLKTESLTMIGSIESIQESSIKNASYDSLKINFNLQIYGVIKLFYIILIISPFPQHCKL